jgi:Zn-finger nucleic acid-binding protein
MNCPRCETVVLNERDRSDVVVDVCPECRGVWLDRGELEKLISRAQRELEEELREARAPEPPRREERARYEEPPRRPREEPRRDAPRYSGEPPRYADDPYGSRPYHKKRRWFDVFDDIFD